MFGGYRFILAILVALSHFGFQPAGFNPGQWAVISFYTLSGLLMERQFRKLDASGNGRSAFYIDRLLRIFPLYFTVLVLVIVLAGGRLAWSAAAENFALFPLNYSYFSKVPVLIGPAWSLACEAHFYLLVPFLVLCPTKTLRIILLASLSFFAASPFLPASTFWAYTGLPGILFTFVTGLLINRKDFKFLKLPFAIMALLLAAFSLTKILHLGLPTGIHINVCFGYLVALVIIPRLDRFSPKVAWDKFLGLFSFPLFLCHEVVAAGVRQFLHVTGPAFFLMAAILFSGLLILVVEIPFDHVRYGLRRPGKSPKLKPET